VQQFSPDGAFLGATPLAPVPDVFYAPYAAAGDLALDGASNLYVIRGDKGLFKYSPAGQLLQSLTVSASAEGVFTSPEGVAVDAAGNVYVPDGFVGSVHKLSPTGQFLLRFGDFNWGYSNLLAQDVVVDGEGSVYTLDYLTSLVRKFSSSGQELYVLDNWMVPDPMPSTSWVTALATDRAGNLYATEDGGRRIHKFSPAGEFLESIQLEGVNYGDYVRLTDLAVDGEGNLYVADATNARVRKYSPAGQVLQTFGSWGSADGQFEEPQGVAVDGRGNVFVSDGRQNRVQKFSPDGRFVEAFGSTGYGNGQFRGARDLVVDAQYNVFVADFGNNRVQKFAPQAPEIAVAYGGTDLANGAGRVDFGTVLPGQSVSRTITVANAGAAPLVLQAIALPAGFTASTGLPATVLPGGSFSLTLSFAPAAAGSYAGAAEILSNDADESPFRLDVSGTARKADQTIAFSPLPDKAVSSPAFALEATASSGLPVLYASSNPAVATVSGNTVTMIGPGQTTITASQAGDDHYNAAPTVAQTLTVLAPPVITRFSPASARPGEAVGVEGNAFAGASAVTFVLSASGKHLVAAFTRLSDGKLSVVVPAGVAADETARIMVQTPGGTATSTDVFTFYPAVPPGLAFYRAINLNGNAITLDGNPWAGKTAPNYATNGENLANPAAVALVPATTAVRTAMIRSAVSRHTNLKLTLTAVPAGTYQVYLYVWEDKKNETYSILLEDKVVQAHYHSGAAGTWRKLGPFEASITDGAISLATTGGAVNFSGVEVWRVTSPAARIAAGNGTEAPAVRLHPNPVRDRLTVELPFPADQVEATAIADAAGVVRLKDAHVAAGPQALHLDVAALPAGLYLLRIEAGTGHRVTRFVKR
ncbi:MAG: choice-of-anchor D domain-containing protein, partial [Cytophagales bacterium]|nr:choice-of-anchor D domain-containing protein [Cytophagales bacterium]